MANIIQQLETEWMAGKTVPEFGPGDTVIVQVRVKEGNRERLQAYEGVVIAKRNRGYNSAFTVRKISHGEGVERVFQTYSPQVQEILVKRRGDVRRAKLYYLRDRTGKAARIKEKSNPWAFLGQLQGFPAKGQHRLPFCVSETFSMEPSTVATCEVLPAPFGRVELWCEQGRLVRVLLNADSPQSPYFGIPSAPAVDLLKRQIEAYLHDPQKSIRWNRVPSGTAFQERVWLALMAIPLGEVRTYGELAKALGSGPRAVAGACRANPWPLLVPCHRVVAANGAGGYCGYMQGPYLEIKRWLLTHEGWN